MSHWRGGSLGSAWRAWRAGTAELAAKREATRKAANYFINRCGMQPVRPGKALTR